MRGMCRAGLNGISMSSLTDVEFELLKAAYRECESRDGCTHELVPGLLVTDLLSGDGAGLSVWVGAEREATPGRRGLGVASGGLLVGG